MNLVISLPNDKWIRHSLIGGITTYIADIPYPWIYGEIALTTGATTAGLRYLFIKNTIKSNYRQDILDKTVIASNSKEKSTLLLPAYGIAGYGPQPHV